ncbi:MAG: AbrB/MazE/SpoVT family DNA-binding domain-containing protein [bacterium]
MPKKGPIGPKPRSIDGLFRVVLPKDVREALHVDRGDYVVFKVEGNVVRIAPVVWKERV